MFEWIADPNAWVALVTLTAMEIVLGIDNIIFISILADRLPEAQRARARQIGLIVAMATRLLLLFSLVWLMGLTEPLFELLGMAPSGRDLILLAGGLFLIAKATLEIHAKLEGEGESEHLPERAAAGFAGVLVQIALLDLVFSVDSVITAVGMAEHVAVMALAIIIAVGVMLLSVGFISEFVDKHPTIKMLALSFLLLIGVSLVGEGLGFHIPKGYIYFAMAFSLVVEMINIRLRGHQERAK